MTSRRSHWRDSTAFVAPVSWNQAAATVEQHPRVFGCPRLSGDAVPPTQTAWPRGMITSSDVAIQMRRAEGRPTVWHEMFIPGSPETTGRPPRRQNPAAVDAGSCPTLEATHRPGRREGWNDSRDRPSARTWIHRSQRACFQSEDTCLACDRRDFTGLVRGRLARWRDDAVISPAATPSTLVAGRKNEMDLQRSSGRFPRFYFLNA